MRELSNEEYIDLFGPTAGDRIRLADTDLVAEVEADYIEQGDESVVGGGKVVRDGLGHASGSAHGNTLDWILTNATIIDPVLGVVKADIGVKDGVITGVGNSGNPDTMDAVDADLVIGGNTEPVDCKGLIATPGGLDIHLHYYSPDLIANAISTGITTMLGGGTGPVTLPIATTGPSNIETMLKAAEEWPVNMGFYGKGSAHDPETIEEQAQAGACGFKIHEDWGAMPATIDTALSVGDEMDLQIILHTDTLNESGFLEDTLEAIGGRSIHLFHIEGAGGGHAPDILEGVGLENVIPSSTNPTNPFTVNTFDEHLDMIMQVHHLDPNSPEDVAFAESRIRSETIAAEDVLHDEGAISVMSSDSMGMGRMAEVVSRTWQTADKMKHQRGPLVDDRDHDNFRIKRYIAKYTINPAITAGIDDYVGSLEPGKLADIVLWDPASFGVKPEFVYKGGFPTWGNVGEANGASSWVEPMKQRQLFGAYGKAKQAHSLTFVSQAAVESGVGDTYGLDKEVVPVNGIRTVTKDDMVHNSYCPDDIEVDSETFEVRVDGEIVTSDPVDEVPLAQRYLI
jgi:urease subunit alpha